MPGFGKPLNYSPARPDIEIAELSRNIRLWLLRTAGRDRQLEADQMAWNLTPPIEVAIFGSCVTRDVFNRKFVPGYSDVFTSVAYAGQTSLLSLMDEVVVPPDLSDLSDGTRGEVQKEFSRQFLDDIRSRQPEYLILDFFADVHFGCVEWNGKLVSRNRWKFLTSEAYKQSPSVREHLPFTDEYLQSWTKALDRFLDFVAQESPLTKIVLHRARNVSENVHDDGTVHAYRSVETARKMNRWWDLLDNAAEDRGVVRVIDVFDESTRTFESHPWGSFYVHYEFAYGQRVFAALSRIALTDARARHRRGKGTSGLRARYRSRVLQK